MQRISTCYISDFMLYVTENCYYTYERHDHGMRCVFEIATLFIQTFCHYMHTIYVSFLVISVRNKKNDETALDI